MKFAIQENLLHGTTLSEQLSTAKAAGVDGIEFIAQGLSERVPEIAQALHQQGLQAAGVHMGRIDGYVSPELDEREAAISALREALADASDIGAAHVIFVPHYGPLKMPNLQPYRSQIELTGEMMVWLLRTVSDLAYAIGLELDMQPLCEEETAFLNTLEQAAFFRKSVKGHPHIRTAPHLYHVLKETGLTALRQYSEDIGYVHLCDANGKFPTQLTAEVKEALEILRDANYTGWVTLTGKDAPTTADLQRGIQVLRAYIQA